MLITTDNNLGNLVISEEDRNYLWPLANINIATLLSEHELLVFPDSFQTSADKIEENTIFTLSHQKLTTKNIMGYIACGDKVTLKITSRFDTGNNDNFLHYLLQKVFHLNVFNFKFPYSKEDIFDFLLFLFPYFFKRALRQGVFKEYQYKNYNDEKVRGWFDLSQHLKHNIPFKGTVAYSTREHSYDNRMVQLIRHTIEYLYHHPLGHNILSYDTETYQSIEFIRSLTPTYHKNQRREIINKNIKPISHPYFSEYSHLQKLCIQILNYEGVKYGEDQNEKIYGILFDGAWLWEEYLATLLEPCHFVHPENKLKQNPVYLFEKRRASCFPDFYKEDFVLDAKYKRLDKTDLPSKDDLYQLVSYMHILKANRGMFVYPMAVGVSEEQDIGSLNGYGGQMKKWGIRIPQHIDKYEDFCKQMKTQEDKLITYLSQ